MAKTITNTFMFNALRLKDGVYMSATGVAFTVEHGIVDEPKPEDLGKEGHPIQSAEQMKKHGFVGIYMNANERCTLKTYFKDDKGKQITPPDFLQKIQP